MKKIALSIVITAFFATASIGTALAEIMLFIGDGCPHCKTVENYIEENNLMGKLPIKIYEVWTNTENQPLFLQKAQEVGYNGQGVPFMVDGNHYEVGSYPIISYFTKLLEAGQPVVEPEVLEKTPSKITEEDSEELNKIIEEKVEDGEKSAVVDPSNVYADAMESSEKNPLKSPIIYIIIGLILISIGTKIYFKKRKK
ncbi:MAG: hypothetical protein PHP74_04405 [Candidatus Gracilibacteria bacterium]|nr:hypothetical protein [Candidatus Gracilibacteria bacterium]